MPKIHVACLMYRFIDLQSVTPENYVVEATEIFAVVKSRLSFMFAGLIMKSRRITILAV